MGSHGSPWSPWGPHGVPMGSPWGPHGSPREPGLWSPGGGLPPPPDPPTFFVGRSRGLHENDSWKIHGKSMGSHGSHGVPWGPMGSPWDPWKIQECRKSWILMKTTIRFDRKLECRGPNRCAIFFRSILSRQNALNRHMEQKKKKWPKIQFFSFSA